MDAGAVLAGAAAVAEAGAAVVAGARGDFGKSITHDYVLPLKKDSPSIRQIDVIVLTIGG
jgi:hypothetical protein